MISSVLHNPSDSKPFGMRNYLKHVSSNETFVQVSDTTRVNLCFMYLSVIMVDKVEVKFEGSEV